MVTTNQKPIVDIHTKKKKESKHNTKDRHQITREENFSCEEKEERKKKDLQKQIQNN